MKRVGDAARYSSPAKSNREDSERHALLNHSHRLAISFSSTETLRLSFETDRRTFAQTLLPYQQDLQFLRSHTHP